MRIGNWERIERARRRLEIRIGLSWKPHDDVRPNRGVGQPSVNSLDQTPEITYGVRPPHGLEHHIGPVLQGQVKMRRDSRRLRGDADQGRRAIHRLERTDSKQHVAAPLASVPQKSVQVGAVVQIASVRADVNASDGDLPVASVYRALHLAENFVNRARTPLAASRRNDAVAALFIASGLDSKGERRSSCDTWLERHSAGPIV